MIKWFDAICIIAEKDDKWTVGFFDRGRMHTRWQRVSHGVLNRKLNTLKAQAMLKRKHSLLDYKIPNCDANVIALEDAMVIGPMDYYNMTRLNDIKPVEVALAPEWARA